MRPEELEIWLVETLADFKLSHSEAMELREILPQLRTDETSYIRNKAFALVREQVVQGGNDAIASLIWLEKVIKTIDNFRQSTIVEASSAHFSPGDDCRNKLLDLCVTAVESIDISVFTIADDRLCDAICTAHRRGVRVRIVTDDDKSMDMGSDIEHMQRQGISIRMDSTSAHMHHKFALFDGKILINGSFNWTRSASDKNQENILVTREPGLVAAYIAEFEALWLEFAK